MGTSQAHSQGAEINVSENSAPNPQSDADQLDSAADQAIAACGGNAREAVKALIVANEYLESEVCELMQAVSHAYASRYASSLLNNSLYSACLLSVELCSRRSRARSVTRPTLWHASISSEICIAKLRKIAASCSESAATGRRLRQNDLGFNISQSLKKVYRLLLVSQSGHLFGKRCLGRTKIVTGH